MSIKIEGPGTVRGSAVKRTGKGSVGAAGSFSKMVTEDTAAAPGVNAATSVYSVDALLGLQEVDDATARAAKGRKRAQSLLDGLDEIRDSLLSGDLPREKLTALARAVQTQRAQVDDPKLAELLDEIDLRAQVELAKYTP